jgi:DNA-binding NarL/FixJ family response regulator
VRDDGTEDDEKVNGRRHTILIADDHESLRRGVRVTLERAGFRVVAECGDGDAAIAEASRLRPELCLLDVHMPFGGIRAAREIHRRLPGTKIVMLTVSSKTDDLFAALDAGACGYLLKNTDPERLPLALLGVLHGEAALPRTLVLRLIEAFRGRGDGAENGHTPQRLTCLTARESDVLELLAGGYSTSQIAARLSIAEVTVRSHISTIMRKLEVRDRDGAIRKLRESDHDVQPVDVLNGRLQ